MKVFLAGVESVYPENRPLFYDTFVLTSFYSVNNTALDIISKSADYLLDSGAYTFMNQKQKSRVCWEEYIERYADFVNKYGVKHFFELDIDSVVGYEQVKEYRRMLEQKTGRQCIPVWHKSRGIDDFHRMTQEYEYAAIGWGGHDIKKSQFKVFPYLLNDAHKNGCKIHGLGFTDTRLLHQYRFDSVDSTSWGWGRFGYHFRFNGYNMQMIKKPAGQRCEKRAELQAINIKEWVKFQKYANGSIL